MNIPINSIESALKHVTRFYSSDFFPAPFEFEAIFSQWQKLRPVIQDWDLTDYTPKTPLQTLAPKPNGTFRIVHQLYASQILSEDERKVWLGIAKERGDLLEKTLADHLLSGLQAARSAASRKATKS